jgi:hypothetical protein
MASLDIFCSVSRGVALIRVTQQPEPTNFNRDVRVPGNAFIARLRRAPNKTEWTQNNFWKKCLPDLQTAYRHICSYTACWLSDSASVDHFVPKGNDRTQAYEWSNYRLASQKVNSKKGNQSVLDPFLVDDTWFVLDFGSSMVRPSRQLPQQIQAQIQNTITVLGLNDDTWIRVRFTALRQYANGQVTFAYLQESYPFIARELERQGRRQSILGTLP